VADVLIVVGVALLALGGIGRARAPSPG